MQVAFSLTLAGGGLGIGKGFIWLENRNIENSLMPPDTEEQGQYFNYLSYMKNVKKSILFQMTL